jgi:hypothetical protein
MELVNEQLDQSDHKRDDRSLIPQAVQQSTSWDNLNATAEVDLNDALDSIPVGVFHYRLLLICGLSFMADGEFCLSIPENLNLCFVFISYKYQNVYSCMSCVHSCAAMEVSLLSFLSPCVAADWDLSDAVCLFLSIITSCSLFNDYFMFMWNRSDTQS